MLKTIAHTKNEKLAKCYWKRFFLKLLELKLMICSATYSLNISLFFLSWGVTRLVDFPVNKVQRSYTKRFNLWVW